MRTRRMAAVAGLLLLLPLASAAEAGPIAIVTVPRVQVDAGALDGILAGVVWTTPLSGNITSQVTGFPTESLDPSNPNPTSPKDWATALASSLQTTKPRLGAPAPIHLPWLTVEAASARVRVYEREELGGSTGTLALDEPLSRLSVAAHAVGDDSMSRLLVFPLGGQVSVARVEGAIDATGILEDPGTTKSQAAPEHGVSLGQTVVATSPNGAPLTVTGSFQLILHGVDVPYAAEGRSGAFETRRVDHEPSAAVAYGSVGTGAYTRREAVIDLFDARLTLAGGALHVTNAKLAAPSVGLEATGGEVSGEDAAGKLVEVRGDLLADLTPGDQALHVRVGGQVERLTLDGEERAVPRAAAAGAAGSPLWGGTFAFALLLLAVPALPAAHWAAGRRRFTKMDRALDRGEFSRALRLADRFTPWPGQRQDGVLAAAICLIGLGRPEEACQRLETGRWSAGRRPMRDFLRARGHAALGETEEATRALAASLLAEPSLIAQARTDPVLAALVEGSRDSATPQEAYA